MLSTMDDYLIHQTEQPLAEVGSSHPEWQEALYFNVHDRQGKFSAVAGLEVMPNAGYVRAFLFTLHDGEHCSYLFAGPLANWREETVAGDLAFAIVDPMRRWRLDLRDEANSIRAALEFQARCPAYHFRPIRIEKDGAIGMHQSYYNQAGVYGGSFTVGDRVFTDLIGLRARRWGVLVLTGLPFYHWVSLHLPQRCITAWQFESKDGEILYCDGAVVTEDGHINPITRMEHDWTLPPGTRHPTRTRLSFSTASGETVRVNCKEVGSHFLGWGPSRWSEADADALGEADAHAMSIEEYCEFTVERERGFGILDIVTLPGYRRYGIQPLY
jgi:hypothetical protein